MLCSFWNDRLNDPVCTIAGMSINMGYF
jgi:hypothetical protein